MKRGLTAILIAALLAGSISGCKQKQTEVTMGKLKDVQGCLLIRMIHSIIPEIALTLK